MRLRRTGTEPLAARSAYGLRRVLAWSALVSGAIATVVFVVVAQRPGGSATGEWVAAGICLLVVIIAVADLLVLRRRP